MTEAIRNAATVILHREGQEGPEVLMGQRGAGAAFMPSKFVFPGGAVDPGDEVVPLARPIGAVSAARLEAGAPPPLAHALTVAAIRELWEETGLPMGMPGPFAAPPEGWDGFAGTGLAPAAEALTFVFRAITPPGRSRRFDARFFLAPVAAVAGDADDFSRASDELSHLQWVPLARARSFDLPFITEVVLAEIGALLSAGGAPESVPFFDNSASRSVFRRIR